MGLKFVKWMHLVGASWTTSCRDGLGVVEPVGGSGSFKQPDVLGL